MDFSWIRYLGRRMHYSKFSQKYHFQTFSFNYIEVNLRKLFVATGLAIIELHSVKITWKRNIFQWIETCIKIISICIANVTSKTIMLSLQNYITSNTTWDQGCRNMQRNEFIVFKSLRMKNWTHLYRAVLAYLELSDHQKPKGITVHLREDFVRKH